MRVPFKKRLTLSGTGALAILGLLVALAVRLAPWRSVFAPSGVLFADGDDYYHLRRMMTAAAQFPFLSSFDRYLGHSQGFTVSWPPLYDWLGGLLMRALEMGRMPTLEEARVIAALIPPFVGLATLALFYRTARRLVDEKAAVAALWFCALCPMLAQYTIVGRPDHHCIENLAIILALPPFADLLGGRSGAKGRRDAVFAAAALAAGTLCWTGTVVFDVILFLAAAAETLSGGGPAPASETPLVFLLQVPVLAAAFGFNSWGREGSAAFDVPSWFQALLALALGLWLALLIRRARSDRRGRGALLVAAVAVTGFTLLRAAPSFVRFTAGMPPPFKEFSELVPFFKPHGVWSLSDAFNSFGAWIAIVPPAAVLLARREKGPRARLILVWLAVLAVLASRQTRYAYHWAFPISLIAGWSLARTWELAARRKGPARAAARAAVVFVAAALTFQPARAAVSLFFADGLTSSPKLIEACDWIRTRTPPTRSLWSDEGRPEYGVYARHGLGHEIAAIAQRPVLAGNWHLMGPQIADSLRLFFLTDADEAYRFLEERGFRYVLLDDEVGLGELTRALSLYGIAGYPAQASPAEMLSSSSPFWRLVYMRLFFLKGSSGRIGGREIAQVPHFRLRHESEPEPNGVARFKIFEVVPGADLSGSCRAGAVVQAETKVVSDRGRSFPYRAKTLCGASGRFDLSLPYPGTYALEGTVGSPAVISEEDVMTGARLKRP
jgi:asparagine N-glycosylation enzyme membrane subunit Stt3